MKYLISLMCLDRPGIVCDLSRGIYKNDGNISQMKQTVLEGFFIGIVCGVFDNEPNFEKLKKDINVHGDYTVNIVPFTENSYAPEILEKYVLTVECAEQKGIIAGITEYLFDNNINIESFSAFAEKEKFYIVAEISIPGSQIALKIKNDIKKLGEKWNLSVHLSHSNIYLATNTVCPTVRIGK